MERLIAEWYTKGLAKQFSVTCIIEQCLAGLDAQYRTCIQIAAYFPQYFDVYAMSVLLGKEFDKTQEMLLTLQNIGILSQEPKQYVKSSRFRLHPVVKEYAIQRPEHKAKEGEYHMKMLVHYKRFAVTMGWLYLRRSESALLAVHLFELEYHNLRNMMQLIMDYIVARPEVTALALDIVTFRELLALRFEPEFLIKWYSQLRQVALTTGRTKIEPQHVNCLVDCANEIGSCLSKLGHVEEAKKQLEAASQEANASGKYLRGECEAFILLGKLEPSDRDAAKQFKLAFPFFAKIRDPILEARCEEHMGRTLINIQTTKAVTFLEKSLDIYASYGMHYNEAIQRIMLGNCYCITDGMLPKALEMYQSALSISQSILQDTILEHYILKRIGTTNAKISEDPVQSLLHLEKYKAYVSDSEEHLEEYAFLLTDMAALYLRAGNKLMAKEHYEKALQILSQSTNKTAYASTLSNAALVLKHLGKMETGIKLLEKAIQIATESNNTASKGIYLHNLGNLYRDLKRYDEAIQTLQQTLVIAQEQGDPNKQAVRLNALGLCYLKAMDTAKATDHFTKALALAQSAHNQKLEACILHNMATASQNTGKHKEYVMTRLSTYLPSRAQEYFEKAILRARENADTSTELECMRDQALLNISLGDKIKGTEGLNSALNIAKAQRNAPLQMELLEILSQTQSSSTTGPTKKSVELLEQAASIAKEANDHHKEAHLYFQIASQYAALKDQARSLQFYRECGTQARALKDKDLLQKVADAIKQYRA